MLKDGLSKYLKHDSHCFEKLLEKIKNDNILLKHEFMKQNFSGIETFSNSCYSTFILQFTPFFDFLTYCKNDGEVISKLKELGFYKISQKHLSCIDEIEKEIRKLSKVDGLIILPYHYLFASHAILTSQFKIDFYCEFQVEEKYNGMELNKLSKDLYKSSRRKHIKNRPDVIDFETNIKEFEKELLNFYNLNETEITNLNKMVYKIWIGNYDCFTSLFQFQIFKISKNKAYEHLFPLFKLIFKKKLLDEDEFLKEDKKSFIENNIGYYDSNYTKYKISKVRDILKLK